MTTAVQSAIYGCLAAHAGLSALVGTRIYQATAPQDVAKPYCVWDRVSLVPTTDLNGSGTANSVDRFRIDVTTWSTKITTAQDVDAQVRLAMAAATVSANSFTSILLDSRDMAYEPDTKLFGVQTDFSVALRL